MNKEFVTYEIALALKELGFNEENIVGYYRGNRIVDLVEYKFTIENYSHIEFIPAPLYQQAFRWFRDKYGLEIILAPDSFNDISKKLREYKIISYDKSWKIEEILEPSHWTRKGCFSTYEEAELECLKKLIEIVKNK